MLEMLTPLGVANMMIAAVITATFALAWWRYHTNTAMLHWMLTAVFMFIADTLLVLRPWVHDWVTTGLAAPLITLAHLLLWNGILIFMGRPPHRAVVVIISLFHLALSLFVVVADASTPLRMMINSAIWMFISLLAAQALRGTCRGVWWQGRELPAAVLALHAIFHFLRVVATGVLLLRPSDHLTDLVLAASAIEVSMLLVSLFISLLTAGMVRWNAELRDALTEVKTLTGLLPICASCKCIRDDRGYWNQVEAYIGDRSHATFTHSICPKCAQVLYRDFLPTAGQQPSQSQ
ncbi:MAG TPA: hypothetical protein PLU52_06950 [Opitutaceae bacterium]|nr:hypothetical protein [Opitutaceae bacterium]HND63084.1 hypothetical protein [Opitutaceae bacterium]